MKVGLGAPKREEGDEDEDGEQGRDVDHVDGRHSERLGSLEPLREVGKEVPCEQNRSALVLRNVCAKEDFHDEDENVQVEMDAHEDEQVEEVVGRMELRDYL